MKAHQHDWDCVAHPQLCPASDLFVRHEATDPLAVWTREGPGGEWVYALYHVGRELVSPGSACARTQHGGECEPCLTDPLHWIDIQRDLYHLEVHCDGAYMDSMKMPEHHRDPYAWAEATVGPGAVLTTPSTPVEVEATRHKGA